ncbi:hypothetical protein BDW66DRAFT_155481 [Aspergillus desertorum]
MARACSAIRRHKEALEHYELSQQLPIDARAPQEPVQVIVEQLCNSARLKHRAGRTDDAVETADKAWRRAIEEDAWWSDDFDAFFHIFIELHQVQRLRPVFDRVVEYFDRMGKGEDFFEDFADYIFEQLDHSTRTYYRVLQYVFTPDDNERLDHLAVAVEKLNTNKRDRWNFSTKMYLLANLFFSKGRVGLGLDGWCQVVSIAEVRDEWPWLEELPKARSMGHLATVCLEQPEIPPSEHCPLKLNSEEQLDEVYLVLSMWLRKRGDLTKAREVLHGRVKHCIALLSDDDISNDRHAYMPLFKTFVADPDSGGDCEAALYLLKEVNERFMTRYNAVISAREADADAAGGSSESPENSQLTDDRAQNDDEDDEDLNESGPYIYLDECVSCRKELTNIHFWYFCRSCPSTTLCRRCSRELKGGPRPSRLFGTCSPEHEFFYTGGLLRPSELVDGGMVPLVSGDGERRAIWIEEWKDRLAEKWQTNDFDFEGGFSCLVYASPAGAAEDTVGIILPALTRRYEHPGVMGTVGASEW